MLVEVRHFIKGFKETDIVPKYLLESSKEAVDDVFNYIETRHPSLFVEMYFRCIVLTMTCKVNGTQDLSFRPLTDHLWMSEQSLVDLSLETPFTYTVDVSYQFEHNEQTKLTHVDGSYSGNPTDKIN